MTASLVATATLFACLSEIETGHDDHKVGRAGEVGRYQIHPKVWRSTTSWPISRAKRLSDSKAVAETIQRARATCFRAIFNREPSVREWYALWNAPKQAYRGRLSKTVDDRAKRFENIVLASIHP